MKSTHQGIFNRPKSQHVFGYSVCRFFLFWAISFMALGNSPLKAMQANDSLPSQLKNQGVLRILGFAYPHMQWLNSDLSKKNQVNSPLLNSDVVNEFRFGYFKKSHHWGWQTTVGYRSEKHDQGYDSVNITANFTNVLLGVSGKYYFSEKGYSGISFGPMVNCVLTQDVHVEDLQQRKNIPLRINPWAVSYFAQLDFGDFKVGPFMSLAPFIATQMGTKFMVSGMSNAGNLKVSAFSVGVNFNFLHKAYLETTPWWVKSH